MDATPSFGVFTSPSNPELTLVKGNEKYKYFLFVTVQRNGQFYSIHTGREFI